MKEDFVMRHIRLLIAALAVSAIAAFPAWADWKRNPTDGGGMRTETEAIR